MEVYLPANLRDTLWFRFEPEHRQTSFRAGSQPSDEVPNSDTGRKAHGMKSNEFIASVRGELLHQQAMKLLNMSEGIK